MTSDQLRDAYKIALTSALRLASCDRKEPTEESKREATAKLGLSEDEFERVWESARRDLWRRMQNWRDDMLERVDEFAEYYAILNQFQA